MATAMVAAAMVDTRLPGISATVLGDGVRCNGVRQGGRFRRWYQPPWYQAWFQSPGVVVAAMVAGKVTAMAMVAAKVATVIQGRVIHRVIRLKPFEIRAWLLPLFLSTLTKSSVSQSLCNQSIVTTTATVVPETVPVGGLCPAVTRGKVRH